MIIRDLFNNPHLEYAAYSNHRIDWDEAWLYCATLTHKNKYDWRMLTLDEFRNDKDIRGWHGEPKQFTFPAVVLPVRDRGPAVT